MMQKGKNTKIKFKKFTCVMPNAGGSVSSGVGTVRRIAGWRVGCDDGCSVGCCVGNLLGRAVPDEETGES